MVIIGFPNITLGKTYCISSRRLYVSETSLPYGLVVYINLFIACFVLISIETVKLASSQHQCWELASFTVSIEISFVQASDDRLLKVRIDHHNQQLLRLINRLFPIIGTSLVCTEFSFYVHDRRANSIARVIFFLC